MLDSEMGRGIRAEAIRRPNNHSPVSVFLVVMIDSFHVWHAVLHGNHGSKCSVHNYSRLLLLILMCQKKNLFIGNLFGLHVERQLAEI